jgi:hypothetical protein
MKKKEFYGGVMELYLFVGHVIHNSPNHVVLGLGP